MARTTSRLAHKRRSAIRQYLLAALLILPGLAQAAVVPFHCVDPDVPPDVPPGYITIWIGYTNDGPTVSLPVGTGNYFSPPPNYRGQLTEFLPGRHERAFSFLFELGNPIPSYNLDGTTIEIGTGLEDYCSATVTDLIVTPSGVLFAGMEEAGVYRSTDGGATWHAVNTGLDNLHVHALELDPTDPSVVFAATDQGVYKSVDGGDTWQAFNSGLPGIDAP